MEEEPVFALKVHDKYKKAEMLEENALKLRKSKESKTTTRGSFPQSVSAEQLDTSYKVESMWLLKSSS